MTTKSTEYYRALAVKERELAKDSTNEEVAVIHNELALGYDALAAQPELRPELPQAWAMSAL